MTTTDATYTKQITRDHGEYRATLDGQLVGYYRTHQAAQTALDTLVYDLLESGACHTAAQLDAGSDADACVVEVAGMVAIA